MKTVNDITEARARSFARRLDKHRERIRNILRQIEDNFEGPLRDEIIDSIQDSMLDLLADYTCVVDGTIKFWSDSPIYALSEGSSAPSAPPREKESQ